MWGPEHQRSFEEDGILRLAGAFGSDQAALMVDAVWRHLEHTSGLRRDDPATWANPPPLNLKRLKRNPVFAPVVDNVAVRRALDGIFAATGWRPSAAGAQILVTFPSPGPWVLPDRLWHMDCGFDQAPWPTFAVKLFACIGELRPGGGATLALAGSHRLVERFGATLDPADRGGNRATWGRFLAQDPWLDALRHPGPEPRRTRDLMAGPRVVDGVPVRVVEMVGDPGDVYVTHLQVFHCASPNAEAVPRLMAARTAFAAPGVAGGRPA